VHVNANAVELAIQIRDCALCLSNFLIAWFAITHNQNDVVAYLTLRVQLLSVHLEHTQPNDSLATVNCNLR